jgi:hypothetical protein
MKVMGVMARWRMGYSVPFGEELVRGYGLVGAMRLGVLMTKALDALGDVYGPAYAQAIVGLTGVWNSCRFCGVGHIYAANLIYFRDTGKLLPISEHDAVELEMVPFREMKPWFRERFAGHEEHRVLADLAERLVDFQLGDTEVRDDDERLVRQAVEMWTGLNECSTTATYDLEVDMIPAADSVNRDQDLIARYRAARAAAAGSG